jgi:hypothetical protein
MATPTYTLIDSVTLGSSASSVTFSSISATGKGDLVIVLNTPSSSGNDAVLVNFNSDSGNNYNFVSAIGNGSTATSLQSSGDAFIITGFSFASGGVMQVISVADFSATNKHKSVLARSNEPGNNVRMVAGRWASTSAITSVTLGLNGGSTFAAGATFNLYQLVSE